MVNSPGRSLFDHPEEISDFFLEIMTHAFDQMDSMAWVLDRDGKILFPNQAAMACSDISTKDVVGSFFCDSPWRNYSDKAKEITREMIKRALSGNSALSEDKIAVLDKLIPVLFSISPIRDGIGNIIALISEAKVIQEQKNLQQSLEKMRWETQQWIDSMGAFVAKCDPEGRIISCNRPFLDALDIKLSDLVGRYICDTTMLGHSSKTQKKLQNALKRGSIGIKNSIEVILQIGRQPPQTSLFSVSPVMDDTDKISFLALEIIDISEQVKLRELMIVREKEYSTHLESEINKVTRALKETEQFNKNLVDSAPIGVIYLDEKERLLFANPKMKHLFETAGISVDTIKNKKLSELGIFPDYSSCEKTDNYYKQKIGFGQMKMLLCYSGNNGNKKMHFEVQAAPFRSASNNTTGTVLVLDDVTERKHLEDELLRTRIRSEKMSSIELLISGVAHELNNPLTSIIGCAEFLMEDSNLSNDANDAVRVIVNDARRAGNIVKNLLAFAPRSVSDGKAVNLNEIVRTVVGIRVHQMIKKGIRIILDLAEKILPVKADVTQMQQVILNLVSNAVDAIDEYGTGDKIIIRSRVDGNWIVLEIKDNGPGISEENLSKIFDPFFTTKPPGKGTGLGLSIAYGIIQEHGGSIVVSSSQSSGSEFIIRLPVYTDSMTTPVQKSIQKPWIPSKVLIVEVEKNIRLMLSRYLHNLGCHVDAVSNGNDALNKLKDQAYDLVLSDIKMPAMNGLALYRQVRAKYRKSAKRFAFMTGISESHMEGVIEAPEIPILQKPFSRRDILRFFRKIKTNFINEHHLSEEQEE